MKYPCAVDAGFSRSSGFWANRIMSADSSWWCHAFIRFVFDDCSIRIFESRIQTRGFTETDPAYYDLEALKEAEKETRLKDVAFVRICSSAASQSDNVPRVSLGRIALALKLCEQWCGAKAYPIAQLAAIWLAKRYGIPVPISEDKLICSEALAVICFELGVDLRDKWHPNFDSVTPGSAWNNLVAKRAGYGQHIIRKEEIKVCGSGYSKYYSLRPRRPLSDAHNPPARQTVTENQAAIGLTTDRL